MEEDGILPGWLLKAAGVVRQAVDPTTPGWSERGVPGLIRGAIEGVQRHPTSIVDYTPVGDAKALAMDAPNAFAEGRPGLGLLALASAVPGVPNLAKNLPMDEASRMARAREMGFDVDTPLYHGTNRSFDEFDPSPPGGRVAGGDSEAAIYMTPDPGDASHYADLAGVRDPMPGEPPMGAVAGDAVVYDGSNVKPVMARTGNLKDVEIHFYNSTEFREILDQARDEGYDGVRFMNVDEGRGPLDQYAIFDPKNVRSRWAAFDPEESGSANLLAGIAGIMGAGVARRTLNEDDDSGSR